MARLVMLGAFRNPGEERAARTLESSLADPALVLSSATVDRRESDLLVLTQQAIFVLEVKDWRGKVSGTDNSPWQQNGEAIENPLDQVDQTWKTVSNALKRKFPEFATRVEGVVVFTHPDVEPDWHVSQGKGVLALTLGQLVPFIQSYESGPSHRLLTPENMEAIATFVGDPLSSPDFGAAATAIHCPKCNRRNLSTARSCSFCFVSFPEPKRTATSEEQRAAGTGGAEVAPGGYPITYDVPYKEKLGRLSTAFRLILAIPQVLIVGGPGVGYGANSQTGLFGAVVAITSFISWFAIMFTKRYPRGLWDMAMTYMRWRANVVTYAALLRDEYPPFGEGDYPAVFDMPYPEQSNRWTVGLRLILVIPHVVVLLFVALVWLATAIIAWFAILFTGRYPEGLFRFGVGTMRWTLRVQAYIYLMRDEYPPFSLSP